MSSTTFTASSKSAWPVLLLVTSPLQYAYQLVRRPTGGCIATVTGVPVPTTVKVFFSN